MVSSMHRSGLKRVVKTVKGQSGKTFKRTYQVRATMAGYKPDPRFNDAWKKTKKGGLNGWPKKIGRKGFDDAMRIAKRKKKWGIFSIQPAQGSEAAASGASRSPLRGIDRRVDSYFRRASPLKRGLWAAGLTLGGLAVTGAAVYGMDAMRARERAQRERGIF